LTRNPVQKDCTHYTPWESEYNFFQGESRKLWGKKIKIFDPPGSLETLEGGGYNS